MRYLIIMALIFFSYPCFAETRVDCSYEDISGSSLFIQQGFVDSSVEILNNPVEAPKARQVLSNVQRIFLHRPSQSILMYGWGTLPDDFSRDIEKSSLLIKRMEKLKRDAESAGHNFNFQLLAGKPLAARFEIAYASKKWPNRELGVEVISEDSCWITMKLGGNRLADTNADKIFISIADDEITRLRNKVANLDEVTPVELMEIKPLPQFNSDNFWAFSMPTLIMAFLIATIIGRAAVCLENKHIAAYFRIMTLSWIIYALFISLFPKVIVGSSYPLNLEHYVYAAIMIIVQSLGMIYGSSLALVSVALALAHSLRTALFTLLDFGQAPRIIWFDVGLMTLISLYVLFCGFRRRNTLSRPSGSVPKVVDRNR